MTNRLLPDVKRFHSFAVASATAATVVLAAPRSGRADVTPLGDYATEVAIQVPEFRGVAPSIKLAYSSSAGNGTLGVGWRLDASSLIVRTGPTGGIPEPMPATDDRFILDGEDLVACKAVSRSPSCVTAQNAFGSSAGFYSTRRESYMRIEHHGGLSNWKVTLPDGRVGHYATFDDGKTWLLTRRVDRHGNGVDYSYTCAPGHECELASIRWGDNGGARGAEVHFYYESRSDTRIRGAGTEFVTMIHRLRSIAVDVGGNLVRAYALTYAPSPVSGRSILVSVQQFGRDATVQRTGRDIGTISVPAGATPPLPATTFTGATSGAAGWQIARVFPGWALFEVPTPSANPPTRHYMGSVVHTGAGQRWSVELEDWVYIQDFEPLIGDFDGDGRADIAVGAVIDNCRGVSIKAELTRKGGHLSVANGMPRQFTQGLRRCTPKYVVADVDGDHRDDVLFTFRGRTFTARISGATFTQAPASAPWAMDLARCGVGDVDGDSRDDLLCLQGPAGAVQLVTARSRGDGSFIQSYTSPGVAIDDPMAVGDINADGLADVSFAPANGANRRLIVARSRGDGTYAVENQSTTWPVRTNDRLTATEVDGDGVGDLVLLRDDSAAGGIALSIPGIGAGRFELSSFGPLWSGATAMIGDVDADGRIDLIHPKNFNAAIGNGQGGFGGQVTVFGTGTCVHPVNADTDGDGRSDLICITPPPNPFSDELRVDDYLSTRAPRDWYRWLSGDFDGDGDGDFVYAAPQRPGVGVTTVLMSEHPTRVPWAFTPPAGFAGGMDDSAGRWMVADVGGPSGRADGKDDLVMVDTDGTTLVVYTLISRGDGSFDVSSERPWRDAAGAILPYAPSDLSAFMPLDIDGDGDADLVHATPSAGGVRLDILRAEWGGQWRSLASPPTYFSGAGIVGVTDFEPVEVNGDGLPDLVHIQAGGGMTGTVLRSLINRGDGTFAEAVDSQSAGWLDIARWLPIDVNGDGLTDFLHVRSSTAGTASGLTLDQLVSRGDGHFQLSLDGSAWLATFDPELTGALEATNSLYPTDFDRDGLMDLLHVSRYRDANGLKHTVLARLLNPGPGSALGEWTVPTPTKVAGPSLSSEVPWAWRGYQDPTRPFSPGFMALVPGSASSAVFVLPGDQLTRIDNGNGGLTDITYAAQLGSRQYMPSRMLPILATSVTRTDLAYSPPVSETTSYAFHDARWSDAQRRMLGFTWTEARGRRVSVWRNFDTGEACSGAEQLSVTFDTTGQYLGFTRTMAVSPGAEAPFTCHAQEEMLYACDPAGCTMQSDVRLERDSFGNTRRRVETIRGAPTRETLTAYYPNEAAYVTSLPMSRESYQDGVRTGSERFYYDNTGNYVQPVHALGEVVWLEQLDDVTGNYVKTGRTYDAHGLLVRTTNPSGVWSETRYDATYAAFAAERCDAIGCATNQWEPGLGKVLTAVDVNQNATRYEYDAHGRGTLTTYADGSWARATYVDFGRVTGAIGQRQRIRTERSDGSSDGVLWTQTYLDGWGRTYWTEREGGATNTIEYDGLTTGPARISETFAAGATPLRFTSYRYDSLGRLVEQTAPDNSTRRWSFTATTMDATDELGKVRTFAYNGIGEVTRVTETIGGIPTNTQYGYDAAGRLVRMTDALGLVTSYAYDSLGRLTAESDPDRGVHEYKYRDDGKLLSRNDAKGQRIVFGYDGAGRPIRRDDYDAAGGVERTVTWTYDQAPGLGPLGASLGRVVRVDDSQPNADLSSTFTYDAMGRVSEHASCIDGACYGMRYGYDPAGRLGRLTYPDASGVLGRNDEVVNYTYDDAGRLIKVVGKTNYVTRMEYEVDGLPRRLEYGNKVVTRYVRDPDRRWPTSVAIAGAAGVFYEAGYTRDVTGRLVDLAERAPTDVAAFTFSYDDAGRLTHVHSSDPRLERRFVYDAIGRITHNSKLGDYHYLDPAHPHAVTRTDFGAMRGYDVKGNAVAVRDPNGRQLKISWTVDDRPARIDSNGVAHLFAYDAEGRRVKKASAVDSATYPNDYLAVEDGVFVKYYFAGDRLIARSDGNAVVYYHDDHSRSTRAQTDAKGSVINAYQYDVTGEIVTEKETLDDNIGFWGVHGDQALGVVAMGARYYDPVSARFLSADSVVRDPYAPQSHDRYAFVEGDPVNYWDPSGHVRRNLIEAMMERKQHMRNLMVAMQWDMCASSPSFCGPANHEIYIFGKDGSVKGYVTRDMHPEIARMQLESAGYRVQQTAEGHMVWGARPADARNKQVATVESATLTTAVAGDVAGTIAHETVATVLREDGSVERAVLVGTGPKRLKATLSGPKDGLPENTKVTVEVPIVLDDNGKITVTGRTAVVGLNADRDGEAEVTAPDQVTAYLVMDLGKRGTSVSTETKTSTGNSTEKQFKDTTGLSLQPVDGLGPSGATEHGAIETKTGTLDTGTGHGATTETPNVYRTAVVFTVIGFSRLATSPAPPAPRPRTIPPPEIIRGPHPK